MFNKSYLDKEDKEELRNRQQLINAQTQILEGLLVLKENWVFNRLKKYGLDVGKKYNVDVESGKITQKKDEPNRN